jgi:hypothetical protein
MESFLSESTVEMIIEGNSMERHQVEAGVRQGSLMLPIHLATYSSGLIKLVEVWVLAAKGLSFMDNLGWEASGSDVYKIVMKFERCTAKSIE